MKRALLFMTVITVSIAAFSQPPEKPMPPLEDYVGKYVFPDGSPVPDVDVVVASGALQMNSAAGSSGLTQLGIDSFAITEFNGTAVFRRGEDKKVNLVYIEAMGYILEGNKMPSGWTYTIRRKEDNYLK